MISSGCRLLNAVWKRNLPEEHTLNRRSLCNWRVGGCLRALLWQLQVLNASEDQPQMADEKLVDQSAVVHCIRAVLQRESQMIE